jgi:hypothetical protein
LREVPNEHIGKTIKCPKCSQPASIFDATILIQALFKNLAQAQTELKQLKEQTNLLIAENTKLKEQTNFATNDKLNKEQQGYAFANKAFAPELINFDGVVNYLNEKKVKVEFKEKQMDISGFFDEIAVKLGDNYAILFPLLDKIRWAYRKNYDAINFDLTDNQKTDQFIMQFCKELYEYGFIVRQFKKRDKNQIHLELQTSTKIMNFFNGEWLEWYAFMKTASLLSSKKITFSSLKNFIFNFENGEKHEADVFFVLPKNKPLWIECKSGEFRQDIQKYTKICKTLNIPKENFLLLVLDESDEKMIGLSNTFDITFVSEKNFLNYIEKLL